MFTGIGNQSAVAVAVSNSTNSCFVFLEIPLCFSSVLSCVTVILIKLSDYKGVGTEGCGQMIVEKCYLLLVERFLFSFYKCRLPSILPYVCASFLACVPCFATAIALILDAAHPQQTSTCLISSKQLTWQHRCFFQHLGQ